MYKKYYPRICKILNSNHLLLLVVCPEGWQRNVAGSPHYTVVRGTCHPAGHLRIRLTALKCVYAR